MRAQKYTVYILECLDGTLYTGVTTDLSRRFDEHMQGVGARYTRSHPPRRILYSETQPNRSRAQAREAVIKRMTRAKKIELTRA